MAQQLINVGTIANDNTGDTLRSAFVKTNDNFSEIYGGLSFSSTNVTLNGELRGPATLVIDPATVGDNTGTVVIKGNLQVDGTTTTINSTTTTIDDPIFTLGGDSAPTVDDNKDRGIEFRYHNGASAKVGFFGFDDSTGYFTFIPDATNTSEVFSGSAGDIQAANFRGNLVGNADTVTNGVYTSGSYANPSWITSLSETKVLPNQTGNNGKYLTTNGTSTSWADITLPSGQTSGSATSGYLQYAGTTKTSGQLYGGTSDPTNTTRLNYDGNLYATNFYGNGANLTSLSAANLSGTISSTVLGNSSLFVGTTSVALNRASANLALTGISSITLPGATSGTIVLQPTATAGTTTITLPATTGTVITTGDSGTVTSTMIADGTIVNADINASAAIAITKLAASTISGVSLGNNLNALTIGTGLSGTSYNGSSAVTIAIDSTIVTLDGTQTLTNKTLTSPTMSTPSLGAATATSINKVAITAPITSATLTIADGKTLTVSNTLTFTGTDASSVAFGAGGTVAYTANKLSVFAATTSSELAGVISDETGSGGVLVFSSGPTFTGTTNFTAISTTGNTSVGGSLTVTGDLVVNGTTTTVNSSTIVVDDKNLELGSVASGTVSTTGTVGSISGTGPWNATITGMSSTTGLIVGSAISATNGTGSLGAGGTYIVASIVSSTSVTYTATGGTTPTAGTVTTITTTGATNTTADGGGITVKGATDKTLTWVNSTSAWTSSEDLNLVTGKVYEINGTTVLSATTLGSGVTASSLTSVGTIGTGTWQGSLISSTYGGTGVNNGGRTITLNTGNLTLTAQAGGSTVTVPSSGTLATTGGTTYIGTTAVTLSRASANLALTGISSVTLPGATSGTILLQPTATAGTTTITLPATTGTVITTGDTGTVTNTMLAGSIATSKITGLATSATTDTTNASNISSGTLPGDRGVTAGSTSASFIEYNGTTKTAGQFDGGTTNPTNTTRLNYDGNFYATNAYFGDIFLYDDSTPSHYLGITNSANLTASRTLSVNVNDANRTISLSGDLTVSAAATVSGTNTGDQTNITGNAGTVTNGVYTNTAQTITGIKTFSNGLIGGDTQSYPSYEFLFDSGTDVANTWKKIITVSSPTGQYQTVGFKIEIVDPVANHATSASVNQIKEEVYYVACVRTQDTVQDTPDACYVTGPSNRIRAIKTSTGNYEVQIQNESQYREYRGRISVYAVNGAHTVTYSNGTAVGTATATYTSTVNNSTFWVQRLGAKGQIISDVATGTAPFTVASTTVVTNLNADLLDGKHTGTSGNTIPLLDGTNSWSGTNTFTNVNISGILDLTNATVANALDLSNNSIVGVNGLTFADPGPNEGIGWDGGNLWKIYESPDDLTTNSGGNLQIVQNATRRATFNTSGQLDIPVATGTAPLVIASTTLVTNLNADLLDGKNTGTSGNTIPLLDGANTWGNNNTFTGSSAAALVSITNSGAGRGLSVDDFIAQAGVVSTATGTISLGTDSGGSISLGRTDAASTPYIDFNSGATFVDFDTRLQASGGNGTSGNGTLTLTGNFAISGNLTVNGTTTTVNSTTVTVDDPIFTLGGDTAPASDDNKDRGIEFRWHNGTAAKAGFFGFDDSTGYFTFIPDATNSSEVFSGTQGDIQASNFRGTLIGSVSNSITFNNGGSGSASGSTYNGSAAVTVSHNTVGALSSSTTSTQSGYFGDIFLYDDSTPSHYLGITNSANLTAARTLGLNVNDADRTISLSGNLTVSAAATVSGTNTGDNSEQVAGSGYDFNNFKPSVPSLQRIVWNTGDSNMLNSPSGNTTGLLLASQGSHGLWNAQVFVQQGSSPELYIRGSSDASGVISWGSWFKALHTGNGSTAGSATSGYLRYAGTTKTAGQFDGGTTAPSNTTRLNYDGNFYATNFYGNGSNLTGIVSPVANSVSVTDSRAVATTPQTINQSVVFDFKQNTTEGLSDGGTYFGEMTFRQYGSSTDWTGGRSHQLGFTDNDNIWHRSGTSTTWGTWYKILHTGNFTLHARPARETVQVISANTNAVSGTTYILTASLTLTLPSSPTSGDYINISNRSGTTSAVIARNGSNIMSLAENMTLDVINASFKLVYADATRGWTVI